MTDQAWVDVAAETEITPSTPRLVKLGRRQLAVLRDEDGQLRAVDNRCPHEGYPLIQGHVRGCTLTCAWHNFKFDLRDGRCLKGDEPVAVYPVRVSGGRVQVDPREVVDQGAVDRGIARLREGLGERKLGQVARETVRLLDQGVPATRLALEAARFDAEHADYGSTHALPVATDVLTYLPRYPGPRAALPLMQAFDLASEPNVRRPARPMAAPIDPGDDPREAGLRLRAMVEEERGEQAEALLRGALAKGWTREQIEPWLFGPCTDHFLSFGHPAIYTVKVFDLLDVVGWEHASALLPALLCRIVNSTREDTLPRWKAFSQRLTECEPALERWRGQACAAQTAAQIPSPDRDALWTAVVDGGRDEAFDAVATALEQGHAPHAIADVIGAAAAIRLLRMDLRHDGDPTVQDGWLDLTHTMTFADAAHHAVQRYPEPSGLRLLFQAARFVNNARTLDSTTPIDPLVEPSEAAAPLELIGEAIVAQQPARAVACSARYLADHGADAALREHLLDLPLRDLYTRPIIVAHAIKLGRVAFELAERLEGTPWATLPIVAFARFAAAPPRERAVARLVHEAERLVVEGKVPRTLT